jgi:hypothetical protein
LTALALASALMLSWGNPAYACRGVRAWPTGADPAALRPGDVVVRATQLESYRDEVRVPSIMGSPYGYIYYLQISEVIGAADADDRAISALRDAKIYVRLNPSICEAYFPNFTDGAATTLVLKMGPTGLYELVGGQR